MKVTVETPSGKSYTITIDESSESVAITPVKSTDPRLIPAKPESVPVKPQPTTLILRGLRLPGYQISTSDRVYEFKYKLGAERGVRIPFSYCSVDIPVENLRFLRKGAAHSPFTIVEHDVYAGRPGENSGTCYPVNFRVTEIDWE